MECYQCGKMSVRDNASLVPIDQKGKGRRWSCLEHLPEGFKIDKGVKELCSLLDEKFEKVETN